MLLLYTLFLIHGAKKVFNYSMERIVTPNNIFNHFQSWYVKYGTNIFPR